MKCIQITNTYREDVLAIVRECVPEGFLVRTLEQNSEEELLSRIGDADYVLASGRVRISASVLEAAGKLKMIQRTGVGLDSLDLDAIRAKGIPLYVNKGVNAQSVAEHTVLLILACLRKLTLIDRNSRNCIWKSKEQAITTYELAGKSVGIAGLGSVGYRVARILRAFGANISYYDANWQNLRVDEELNLHFAQLDELFAASDIITLHCLMINRDSLEKMKDGVNIINTVRGGLIDEKALYQAINSGKVSFAGLDVHAEEPYSPGDPLISCDHVISTPHIGGVTRDSFRKMMSDAMRNIDLYDQGRLEEIEQYRFK